MFNFSGVQPLEDLAACNFCFQLSTAILEGVASALYMAASDKRLKILKRHLEATSMSNPPPVRPPITTHVLDTAKGQPAGHMTIKVFVYDSVRDDWSVISEGVTNEDGRCPSLLAGQKIASGCYKIKFDTKSYFDASGIKGFYPYVEVS
jgi:5-hydroxyisourate hydrolase